MSSHIICSKCGTDMGEGIWMDRYAPLCSPCIVRLNDGLPKEEVAILRAEVERVTRERDEAQRAKFGTPCQCETWIEACRSAEAQVAALKAELAAAEKAVDDFEEERDRARAENERLRKALTEIRDRCRGCRCGYSPCGCGAFAEDVSDAALQPQTRGEG